MENYQNDFATSYAHSQVKEKQLKDMEANLEVVKVEAETERNRFTVLVNRLESSLSNQGTEVCFKSSESSQVG